MIIHPTSFKTLGRESAHLIVRLNEERRTVFSVDDVMRIMNSSQRQGINFVGQLIKRGLVTRLRPGLYNLVPFELGQEKTFVSDPYLVAKVLIERKLGEKNQEQQPLYYFSHSSAMAIHQMLTQPQLNVVISSPLHITHQWIQGIEFNFVHCQRSHLFGITSHWLTKTDTIFVSDPERTILDGLKNPKYCGGLSEIAKGLWMQRHQMTIERLVDYALKLGRGSVIRRLGFLLETYHMADEKQLKPLLRTLTRSYMVLDPTLPKDGKFCSRWKIQLNITRDEIESVSHS